MSSISKQFYSHIAPVLNEPGWVEADVQQYGSVFFRNTVFWLPNAEITVGIVVNPNCWHYWGTYATPGYSGTIDIIPLPSAAPWDEVQRCYIDRGLEHLNIGVTDCF